MDALFLLTPKPCFELFEPMFRSYPVPVHWVESVQDLKGFLIEDKQSLKNNPFVGTTQEIGQLFGANKESGVLNATHIQSIPEVNHQEVRFQKLDLSRCRLVSIFTDGVVPPEVFEQFGLGFYNFHPGPPSRPGWAPLNYALFEGDECFGVTLHEAIREVDAGTIIATKEFKVPEGSNYHSLAGQTFEVLLKLLEQYLPYLLGDAQLTPELNAPKSWGQNRKTKKDLEQDAWVSPGCSREELMRKIKAFGMSREVCTLKARFQGKTYEFDPLVQPQSFLYTDNTLLLSGVQSGEQDTAFVLKSDCLEIWGVKFISR